MKIPYLVGIITNRPEELRNLLSSMVSAKMDPNLVYVWDDSPSHLEDIDALIEEYKLNEVDKAYCSDPSVTDCKHHF